MPLRTRPPPWHRHPARLGPAGSPLREHLPGDLSQPDRAIDAAVRAATGGYDPAPALAALHVPAIWIYGQLDRQVPVRVSVADLAAYHNPDWTVIVLPGGSHGLIATSHGLDTELADATRFAPGYFTALRAWIAAHVTFPPNH